MHELEDARGMVGADIPAQTAGPYCFDAYMTVAVPLFRQAVGLPVLEQLDNDFDAALATAWDNWSNLRPWRLTPAPSSGAGAGLGIAAALAIAYLALK